MAMKRLAVGLGALAVLAVGTLPVQAQGISQHVAACDPKFPTHCAAPDASGALPITGTITTSLGAFNPTGSATLSLSTTSARVALPSADPTALIRNTGSVDAYIAFGNSSVTATTSNVLVPAGQAIAFNVGTGTYVAGITGSSTSSLAISTGTGLPTMTGGGGTGGGAVTIASGADVVEGATTDTSATNTVFGNLQAIKAAATGSIPAGSAIIGKVGIDQTTPGTTNGVVNNAATVGGATPTFTAALSSTVTQIKASAGQLYMLRCYNPNASAVYIQVFNLPSASVTIGSTTPTQSYGLAATAPGGFAMSTVPIALGGSGISYAATTTSTGSTAPGSAVSCNVVYQ